MSFSEEFEDVPRNISKLPESVLLTSDALTAALTVALTAALTAALMHLEPMDDVETCVETLCKLSSLHRSWR